MSATAYRAFVLWNLHDGEEKCTKVGQAYQTSPGSSSLVHDTKNDRDDEVDGEKDDSAGVVCKYVGVTVGTVEASRRREARAISACHVESQTVQESLVAFKFNTQAARLDNDNDVDEAATPVESLCLHVLFPCTARLPASLLVPLISIVWLARVREARLVARAPYEHAQWLRQGLVHKTRWRARLSRAPDSHTVRLIHSFRVFRGDANHLCAHVQLPVKEGPA